VKLIIFLWNDMEEDEERESDGSEQDYIYMFSFLNYSLFFFGPVF